MPPFVSLTPSQGSTQARPSNRATRNSLSVSEYCSPQATYGVPPTLANERDRAEWVGSWLIAPDAALAPAAGSCQAAGAGVQTAAEARTAASAAPVVTRLQWLVVGWRPCRTSRPYRRPDGPVN